jgi:CHAT domain-containing protein/Tfp pilus assembly protein PilF
MKLQIKALIIFIVVLSQGFYISKSIAEKRTNILVLNFDDLVSKASQLSALGLQQYRRGLFKEALQTFMQELEIRKSFDDSIAKSRVLNNLGLVYSALGDQQKALSYYYEALPLLRSNQDRSGESRTLNNIGLALSSLGQQYEALKIYQQALPITRDMQDKLGEATTLNNIALAYTYLGESQKALDYYSQSISISRSIHDHSGLCRTLSNLGGLYAELGDQRKALDYFQEALPLLRITRDSLGETTTLSNMGAAYSALGEKQKALDYYNQALLLSKSTQNRPIEAKALNNIGSIYDSLGEKQKALDYYNQALLLFQDVKDQNGLAITLDNIGKVYDALNDKQRALDYFDQALIIFRAIKDPRGQATNLNNIGHAYSDLGSQQKALDYYLQALPLYKMVGDLRGVATILNNVGTIYESLGEKKKALEYFSQSLPIFRSIGDRQGEALALRNLGETTAKQNRPELSIFFLKNSVNLTQTLRQDIDKLPESIQKTYANSQSKSYRILAKYLLEQGRILEAEEVLDLLKIEEINDYFRGDLRGNAVDKKVVFLRPEQQILERYNASLSNVVKLGQELELLQNIAKSGGSLTGAQKNRVVELDQILSEVKSQFVNFINSKEVQQSEEQLARSDQQQISLAVFDKLRKNLRVLGNSALIYPLVLEDRIELIITTPDAPPLRRVVKVSQAELNQLILDYRDALEFPRIDPKPVAQKLYQYLIQPLEADLKQGKIKTILYAPDGPLRYVPLAALYDGQQWLAQRYAINNITAASLTELSPSQPTKIRVLAGAFANDKLSYKVQVRNESDLIFRGLPFAGKEVSDVAKAVPDTDKRLDQAFSLKSLKPHFSEYSVLHFATHTAFFPARPEDSFLLFGDGDRATLSSIASWSLSGVQLVILSACGSGLGTEASPNDSKPDKEKIGNGAEILGLGYQFQTSGARATIASLWNVDDGGTQSLMSAFYNLLKKGNISKTEALRQAQVMLIEGKVTSQAGVKNLAHPHYWGPFFLIGNGL